MYMVVLFDKVITINLQGFFHLLGFKAKEDESLMRKLPYQYVLNLVCLFLSSFPWKCLLQAFFGITVTKASPPVSFLQYKQTRDSQQIKKRKKEGNLGKECHNHLYRSRDWIRKRCEKKHEISPVGFCLQLRSHEKIISPPPFSPKRRKKKK